MTIQTTKTGIHIPNIEIGRFRGIRDLEIPRLGQVNLFGGKNGAGKTSLLEAIDTYAGGMAIEQISNGNAKASISSGIVRDEYEYAYYSKHPNLIGEQVKFGVGVPRLKLDVHMAGSDLTLWHDQATRNMGLGLEDYGSFNYDHAVIEAGQIAVPSLRDIVFEELELLGHQESVADRARMAIFDSGDKIPIAGLGRGAVNMIDIMARLAYCSLASENINARGVFLVDEIDDGLHRTVHTEFWRLIMREAYARNVQVFATTHSWDCILGFAEAGMEFHHMDPLYYRLERGEDRTYAIGYKSELLHGADEWYADPR